MPAGPLIEAEKANHAVGLLCLALAVSRSGFLSAVRAGLVTSGDRPIGSFRAPESRREIGNRRRRAAARSLRNHGLELAPRQRSSWSTNAET
jgi:hypothetical protein